MKNIIRLKPIPELDEEELEAPYFIKHTIPSSNPKLTFVKKYHKFNAPRSRSDSVCFSSSELSTNKENKKTIYQIEKEKLNNDPKYPNIPASRAPWSKSINTMSTFNSYSFPSKTNIESEFRAVYLPYTNHDIPNFATKSFNNLVEASGIATASPYVYLGSEQASVLKIFISSPKKPKRVYCFSSKLKSRC